MLKYAKECHQNEMEQLNNKQELVQVKKLEAVLQMNHLQNYWEFRDEVRGSKRRMVYAISLAGLFVLFAVTASSFVYALGATVGALVSGIGFVYNHKILEETRKKEGNYEDLLHIPMARQEEMMDEDKVTVRKANEELKNLEKQKQIKESAFLEKLYDGMNQNDPFFLADSREEYQSLKEKKKYSETALEDYIQTLEPYADLKPTCEISKVKVKAMKQRSSGFYG